MTAFLHSNLWDLLHQRQRGSPHVHPSLTRLTTSSPLSSSLMIHTSRQLRGHAAWAEHVYEWDELEGHEGCVNRLAWNKNGSLLATGSDDCHVRIWSYTHPTHTCLHTLRTRHYANIFGVAFALDETAILSGGMDCELRLSQIETEQSIARWKCHRGRVKDVRVDLEQSAVGLSASEDGTCRLLDLREPHTCGTHEDDDETDTMTRRRRALRAQASGNISPCKNVLVNVGRSINFKGISQNPHLPHYLAFACGDQYVRVYDRRMLSLGDSQTRMNITCVAELSPEHLKRHHHCTYASWSPDGTQIVATYSGEHAYLFDFDHHDHKSTSLMRTPIKRMRTQRTRPNDMNHSPMTTTTIAMSQSSLTSSPDTSTSSIEDTTPIYDYMKHSSYKFGPSIDDDIDIGPTPPPHLIRDAVLSEDVNKYKLKGNEAFAKKDFSTAICHYTAAILCQPTPFAPLYSNRAAAYLKRGFAGDATCALRDTEMAIHADETFAKAYYRKIQALQALSRHHRALALARTCMTRFPEMATEFAEVRDEAMARLEMKKEEEKKMAKRKNGGKTPEKKKKQKLESDEKKDTPTFTTASALTRDAFVRTSTSTSSNITSSPQTSTSTSTSTSTATSTSTSTSPSISTSTSTSTSISSSTSIPSPTDTTMLDDSEEAEFDDINDMSDTDDDDEKVESESEDEEKMEDETTPHRTRTIPRASFAQRFVGHANTQTDIKECTFWGRHLIMSGSDDGHIFIWNRLTGQLLNILNASQDVINCVQAHPLDACVASSGIDHTIKLWTPARLKKLSQSSSSSTTPQESSFNHEMGDEIEQPNPIWITHKNERIIHEDDIHEMKRDETRDNRMERMYDVMNDNQQRINRPHARFLQLDESLLTFLMQHYALQLVDPRQEEDE